MRLSELLPQLQQVGISIVARWESFGKKGITLGDPQKFFPHPSGSQYPIDITKDSNPDLDEEEVRAIRRRFGMGEV